MHDYIGKKVLITTDDWFTGPDANEYKAIYGTLKAVHEVGKTLGFIPNRSHANWFLEVGNMTIMGCRVRYVLQVDQAPPSTGSRGWTVQDGKLLEYDKPNMIYFAE
jgi:hypothetical protein